MRFREFSTSGLVGYWKMDEGTGTITIDRSGNANTGTITGSTRVAGKELGGALSLNGTSDFVGVGDDNSLKPANAISLVAWVNPVNFAAPGMVIARNPNFEYEMQLFASNNAARFLLTTSGGETDVNSPINSLTAGVWNHVVMTYDGATHYVYIDGAQQVLTVNAGPFTGPITDASTSTRIGRRNTLYLNGIVDEVRIYDRAIEANEIAAMYAAGRVVIPINRLHRRAS